MKPVPKQLQEAIDGLRFHCENYKNGCCAMLKHNELDDHLKTCEFKSSTSTTETTPLLNSRSEITAYGETNITDERKDRFEYCLNIFCKIFATLFILAYFGSTSIIAIVHYNECASYQHLPLLLIVFGIASCATLIYSSEDYQ
ncbi:hypothetical protein B4U79_17884 [Dinothrombium tinctorium]|uniref:Uncharacterized protein n=1 Tax=Dinothrombium tinctorium TaxID=1965070 RepID=A0A443RLH9_9ACAR|nr:hypothetical protein B4U79_17884 [Dinothrombium tinctorium]